MNECIIRFNSPFLVFSILLGLSRLFVFTSCSVISSPDCSSVILGSSEVCTPFLINSVLRLSSVIAFSIMDFLSLPKF